MTCGIYMINNKKTDQVYIGQSKNIEARFSAHCRVSAIDRDIILFGRDNFDFIILEKVPEKRLNEREMFWIQKYDAHKNPKHYNKVAPDGIKYTLWNSQCCGYHKSIMFYKKRLPDLCRCFSVRYEGYQLPLGGYFHDFVTCEIIFNLVKNFSER